MSKRQEQYDVIIIGAGFTGVTAARELSHKGFRTLILEARDRLGGRTWHDRRLGIDLEMGGTWVHWFQPYVWAEIGRYGLDVVPSPVPNTLYWIADGKRHEGKPDEFFLKIDGPNQRLLEPARRCFPLPYIPLSSEEIHDIDQSTLKEKLAELQLSDEEHDMMESMWSLNFNSPLDEAGFSQALHWAALSDYNWKLMMDICSSYKLTKGTKTLIECIFNDAKTDILFSSPVKRVNKIDSGYKAITYAGDEYTAKAVINTLPVNILNSITFSPPLSAEKTMACTEKQSSKGVKFWAKIKGVTEPFAAFAPSRYPIHYAQFEYVQGADGIIVGFGADAEKLDPNNRTEVESALRHLLPDIKVLESCGHNWVNDPFSGETWTMKKKGQLTSYLSALQEPEEGIFIGGSSYANGWAGFIDGAIESAYAVSRLVCSYLNNEFATGSAVKE
ncbi:FAD-dependent oxidoreductase [Bacillus sp. T17B1]|uniref:flavin monoamine oxidase family protein n=1 Tax=Bacillus sp. T17B1 TaxID=2918911 RepID=UPI00227FC361|nr:FAD-dependent oxidoreductase [Bacillus sp. T17B1]